MKSWKTTVAGIGVALVAIGSALQAQFDGDPATSADWGIVIAAMIAAVGLFWARDNNRTSEQVGAK